MAEKKNLEYAPVRAELHLGKLTLRVDGFTVEEVKTHLDAAEKLLSKYVPEKPPASAPGKQPEGAQRANAGEIYRTELQSHAWKGKKQPDGSYAEGSLKFGWDFANNFLPETVEELIQGKLEIDGVTFSINENHKIVTARENR